MSISARFSRVAFVMAATAIGSAGLVVGVARAGTLSAFPSAVASGDVSTVSFAAALSGMDGIAGFDLTVTLDPLLTYVQPSFALSGPLIGWSATIGGTGSTLSISLANLAGLPDPDTNGLSPTLFTFSVRAGNGTGAPVGITLNELGGAVGQPGEFQTAPASAQLVVRAPVMPVPIPAPGPSVLAGPGLIALLAARRARKVL